MQHFYNRRDVMTLPSLMQYIFSALELQGKEMNTIEAKLNLIQTTFLTLQISSDLERDDDILYKAHHVFRTLFTRHFDESVQASTWHAITAQLVIVFLPLPSSVKD